MTKREYLAIARQPEYCGINARAMLKAKVRPRGLAIDRKVNLNAVSAAVSRLREALS